MKQKKSGGKRDGQSLCWTLKYENVNVIHCPAEIRPVARIFYGWVRSVDYTDQRAPEALFTRGVRGMLPREILKIKLSETAFRAF